MFQVKLLKKIQSAEDTYEFIFSKPDGYAYHSGQHAGLILKDPLKEGSELRHTFSFTSSPTDNELSFLTRIRESEYKKLLSSLNEGDEATVALPGGFEIAEGLGKEDNFVYLTAGVGITPFLSFLRNRSLMSEKGRSILMWSNRDPKTTPYYENFIDGEFSDIENLAFHLYMTDSESSDDFKTGRIDKISLRIVNVENEPVLYYVIGMPSFVDAMTSQLISLDIPFEKIITENFSGY